MDDPFIPVWATIGGFLTFFVAFSFGVDWVATGEGVWKAIIMLVCSGGLFFLACISGKRSRW